MAPVIKELEKHSKEIVSRVCVTAQHREMLDQVLNIFNIKPDYDLDIMGYAQTLFDVTTNVLKGLKEVFEKENPNLVLVHGDTTTTFSASLAAYYRQIKVGHVEAGLRTYNKYSPFPEELNRRLTGVIADYHFAPTERAKQNLLRENVNERDILVTGNTVIDALFWVKEKINKDKNRYKAYFKEKWNINLGEKPFVVVTGHRRENFGESFRNFCLGLKDIIENNMDIELVYPVHLNPNVQKPVYEILGDNERIHLIEPLNYELFVYLMDNAKIIITDSGGVQEEAPSLGKPVLVTRDITERPEAVEAGTVKIVGTDREKIFAEANRLLNDPEEYKKMSSTHNPYGDGKAAQRIVEVLRAEVNYPRLKAGACLSRLRS